MCLKLRDSVIYFSHCTIPTRTLNINASTPPNANLSATGSIARTTYNDTPRWSSGLHSRPNTEAQQFSKLFPMRDPTVTVGNQLALVRHAIYSHLTSLEVSAAHRYRIAHGTHELPSELSSFAGLVYLPCSLYKVITFDKMHFLDVDIARHFCDMINTIIKNQSALPLSRIIPTLKNCYYGLP